MSELESDGLLEDKEGSKSEQSLQPPGHGPEESASQPPSDGGQPEAPHLTTEMLVEPHTDNAALPSAGPAGKSHHPVHADTQD